MTLKEVKEEILKVIVESAETELDISESTDIAKDMGLSSMEVVVLLGDLEQRFGINIPVKRLRHVRKVGDLSDVVIALLME